ncbi:hypothetical protein [Veillonella sp.]|uniref:hypothetical protein n=1 Tax=Veillonella sp. TaxID=1926307 RepID=UPI0025DB72DA|nr:hypothetical protein [Veillonella sp.]
MKNEMSREELVAYAKAENRANKYGAPAEAIETLGDLLAYVGNEMYRPVTRLMLANWAELNERIDNFSAEEWAFASDVASKVGLDKRVVALLIEVLEGADTPKQVEDSQRTELNEEERIVLQQHIERVREEEAAQAAAEANRLMAEEGK